MSKLNVILIPESKIRSCRECGGVMDNKGPFLYCNSCNTKENINIWFSTRFTCHSCGFSCRHPDAFEQHCLETPGCSLENGKFLEHCISGMKLRISTPYQAYGYSDVLISRKNDVKLNIKSLLRKLKFTNENSVDFFIRGTKCSFSKRIIEYLIDEHGDPEKGYFVAAQTKFDSSYLLCLKCSDKFVWISPRYNVTFLLDLKTLKRFWNAFYVAFNQYFLQECSINQFQQGGNLNW